ncbi:MAG: TldD/PmbA family protein [Clostridiaceae bacterium]|jgi:PmbA protein|nr:TldD/PmbA family protein [Clostridiaceae bacterium]
MEKLENDGRLEPEAVSSPLQREKFNMLEHYTKIGLDALKEGGTDQARCVATRRVTREISAEAGEFSLYRTLFDDSMSFMAIDNEGRRGTLSQNSIDEDDIRKGAATCLASAKAAVPDKDWQLAPALPIQTFESGPHACDESKLFERSQELLTTIRDRFPKIMVETLTATHVSSESCANYSTGSRFFTRESLYGISIMFSGQEGLKTSSFFGSGVQTYSLDRPFIEMGSLEADLTMVSEQVDTKPMDDAFEGTVLMVPDCFGDLLETVIGTFASDSVLIEKTSVWKDKLGEPVASPALNVRIAPLHPDIVAGERFSAEGYLSEDFAFIEDGVLKQFCLSDYASRKTGLSRAPNQSMSLVVQGGDKTVESIISSIDRGILIGRVSGGQPSTNGDFSAVAKNAFLIENGKIVHALNETMINGNLADLLLNIRALSSDVVKDGGSVLPWVAFGNVLISGK